MSENRKDTSWKARLRMECLPVPFHVVLVNPEIPQNTGNIARLCAATGSNLHLVGQLGFSTDEKAVRRAGLDYWHLVDINEHRDFESCLAHIGCESPFLFTTGGAKTYVDAPFQPGSVFVFGSESVGLPNEIMERYSDNRYGIPTLSKTVRSLNLGNSVGIVLYKGLESVGAFSNVSLKP